MRRTLLLALPLVALFGGCHASSKQDTPIEYRPGTEPTTHKAAYDATYTLHSIDTDGRRSPPLDRTMIERAEQVGFVRQPDGSLVAYARGRKIPLEEGCYVWEMAQDGPDHRPARWEQGIGGVVGSCAEFVSNAGAEVVKAAGQIMYGLASAGSHR